MNKGDAAALARLHRAVFPGYDATALGPAYLKALYATFAASSACISAVAEENGDIVGWVAGVGDYAAFYRALVARCLGRAPLITASALMNRPALIGRAAAKAWWVIRRLALHRRSNEPPRAVTADRSATPGAPPAHLLVIGVEPGKQRRGIGRTIIEDFHARLRAAGFGASRLSCFVNNAAGNGAFGKAGYRIYAAGRGVNFYAKNLFPPDEV